MKKFVSCFLLGAALLSMTGCKQNKAASSVHHSKMVKVEKAKHAKKHKKEKKQKRNKKKISQKSGSQEKQTSNQTNSQQAANQQNQGQQTQQLTQGQINMQRGYDPNGAPLLPGQDHAAGANPDGTPDPWVQGQINWAIRNGYMNPDGSTTEKGKEMEQHAADDSFDPDPSTDDTAY